MDLIQEGYDGTAVCIECSLCIQSTAPRVRTFRERAAPSEATVSRTSAPPEFPLIVLVLRRGLVAGIVRRACLMSMGSEWRGVFWSGC
jgi:hypothetical protein